MFSSKNYLLGNSFALLIGGIIFIIGSIILPMIDSKFRTTEMLVITLFIGPAMIVGGLLFYVKYKAEEKEALRVYQQNEKLKKEIKELKNIKEGKFKFDDKD